MECKAHIVTSQSALHLGINRNIVECKGMKKAGYKVGIYVLIETLWNVKSAVRLMYFPEASSINRNIVECKVGIDDNSLIFLSCINRNIVECKAGLVIKIGTSQFCINRNIVECKGISLIWKLYGFAVLIETLWNVKWNS